MKTIRNASKVIHLEALAPSGLIDALKRQKYHFVGKHSAVKRCRWLYETLIHNRPCYKQKFYGIKTHQCIQMTPTAFHCTQQCLFCWRAQNGDLQTSWNELKLPNWDPPDEIFEGCIRAQRALLSGYKDNPKTNKQKLREAFTPKQVAISLAGEPTLYQPLGELIRSFKNKGFTTFLVSNGTIPSALAELSEEPTQLYVSVCAPDEESFDKVCRPQISEGWKKLNDTLSILSNFRCPTAIRITSIRGLNMENASRYSKLIMKAEPTYVEAKAYMHVGFSTLRLGYENTPSHDEIRTFAMQLSRETSYKIIDESIESRVVLLSRLRNSIKFGDRQQ